MPVRFFTCLTLSIGFLACTGKSVPAPTSRGMVSVPAAAGQPAFLMDSSPVTVAQFRAFARAKNFVTQAERFGDAGVFDPTQGTWVLLKGADWQYPRGRGAEKAPDDHPVTQVSWDDACSYCAWLHKRLPTRAEFEYAAANAKAKPTAVYAWGDFAFEKNEFKTNYWQGRFPENNTGADGFLFTNPVGHFGANALGLTDMGGNVWQWVSDWSTERPGERVQCGGSFLCDPAVCHGFKIGGTSSSTPETSLMHIGFRCAL
jgi:formylglycine-generating enzyme